MDIRKTCIISLLGVVYATEAYALPVDIFFKHRSNKILDLNLNVSTSEFEVVYGPRGEIDFVATGLANRANYIKYGHDSRATLPVKRFEAPRLYGKNPISSEIRFQLTPIQYDFHHGYNHIDEIRSVAVSVDFRDIKVGTATVSDKCGRPLHLNGSYCGGGSRSGIAGFRSETSKFSFNSFGVDSNVSPSFFVDGSYENSSLFYRAVLNEPGHHSRFGDGAAQFDLSFKVAVQNTATYKIDPVLVQQERDKLLSAYEKSVVIFETANLLSSVAGLGGAKKAIVDQLNGRAVSFGDAVSLNALIYSSTLGVSGAKEGIIGDAVVGEDGKPLSFVQAVRKRFASAVYEFEANPFALIATAHAGILATRYQMLYDPPRYDYETFIDLSQELTLEGALGYSGEPSDSYLNHLLAIAELQAEAVTTYERLQGAGEHGNALAFEQQAAMFEQIMATLAEKTRYLESNSIRFASELQFENEHPAFGNSVSIDDLDINLIRAILEDGVLESYLIENVGKSDPLRIKRIKEFLSKFEDADFIEQARDTIDHLPTDLFEIENPFEGRSAPKVDFKLPTTSVFLSALDSSNGTGGGVSAVPLPFGFPLLAAGLGFLVFVGWRGKRSAA